MVSKGDPSWTNLVLDCQTLWRNLAKDEPSGSPLLIFVRGNVERTRMKKFRWLNLIILLTLLAGCSSNPNGGIFLPFSTATPLPLPSVGITPAPDADAAMRAYLDAKKNDDYAGM